MLDPTVIASAVVIVVASIAGAAVTIMKQQTAGKLEILKATREAAAASAKQGEAVQDIKSKVNVVEHQTNSINTANMTTIKEQEVQIAQLQVELARLEKIAIALAAAPVAERRGIVPTTADVVREIRDAAPPKDTP